MCSFEKVVDRSYIQQNSFSLALRTWDMKYDENNMDITNLHLT